jgi:hypothetical protein
MLYKGFDASVPPEKTPAGMRFVLGYIGGRTPHVWSLEEWLSFGTLRQFPCWVADFGAPPEAQADTAAARAVTMGWYDNLSRVIVLDSEAIVNRAWYQRWARRLAWRGYLDCNYGSLGSSAASGVEANGSRRVWAALWDGDPVLEGGQEVQAHQYEAGVPEQGTAIDLNVMEHALFVLGGGGPRRAQP